MALEADIQPQSDESDKCLFPSLFSRWSWCHKWGWAPSALGISKLRYVAFLTLGVRSHCPGQQRSSVADRQARLKSSHAHCVSLKEGCA